MSAYSRLAEKAEALEVHPESTSYFSEPTPDLDPFLFTGMHMRPAVRMTLLGMVLGFLRQEFNSPEGWARAWVAGSGVSYQWSASRDPGDLDVLIGVDMPAFRRANPDLAGLSDHEIAQEMNRHFRECLSPLQHDWNGYDVTMYVNDGARDIRDIHPYAAYDLTDDAWTVAPDPHPQHPSSPDWERQFANDAKRAQEIVSRYDRALAQMHGVSNPGMRLNAEITVRTASQEAIDLFDEIHSGRHDAFGPDGQGYADYANHRWQAGKASGAIPALKAIKDAVAEATDREETSLYGSTLPNAHDSLVAAAISRRFQH